MPPKIADNIPIVEKKVEKDDSQTDERKDSKDGTRT